jgi:uroporphyrin-III C-methyltransferase
VVLPEALARNTRFAAVRLRQTPPVGTHAGIAPLVARRVTELLREQRAERDTVALVLVGHGTARHPQSRTATLHLADTLRRRRVAGEVVAAFLDDDPPIDEVVARLRQPTVLVVPFLIGGGAHALEDIPRLVGLPDGSDLRRGSVTGRLFLIDDAVGSYPGVEEIVVDLARRHTPPPAPRFRPRMVTHVRKEPGPVHLVGGGPGDPGLITSRGLDLLRAADVVVHDRLIGAELLQEAKADAELIDVGKGPGHAPYTQEEINALLVARARDGRTVVRLKGGDPFVFGRGSEEAAACRAGGVPVYVVPGVSSAIAAPAAAGIPVTARGLARSFAVVTAHQAGAEGDDLVDVRGLAAVDTLVVLMGRAGLERLAAQLVEAGRDPATPAACIQSATTPEQRVTRATLATIAAAADRDGLQNPVVIVIGAVAALAEAELDAIAILGSTSARAVAAGA